MNPTNKKCQSCGMPLKRDEKGGGTNADGSKNTTYCSHCFVKGKFVLPEIAVFLWRIRPDCARIECHHLIRSVDVNRDTQSGRMRHKTNSRLKAGLKTVISSAMMAL